MKYVQIGSLALDDNGAFKIGPFGSSLKRGELVDKGIPVVGIENVRRNEFIGGFQRFVSSSKCEELSDYVIQEGDVLVTTMGTIGRAAVAPPTLGKAIFDSHLFRMRVDAGRVLSQYLAFAVNSDLVVRQLTQMARGSIMEGLNTAILRECIIPLPELSEQVRIVAILRKADRLRRTRQYSRVCSEQLLMTVFLKRFREAFQCHPLATLGELVSITGGGTPSRERPEYFRGRIPWLTSKDMTGDYIWDTEEHITEEAINGSATKLVPKGSILLVVKSKVLMHRLPIAISKVSLCHGQDIKSIQCSPTLNAEFVRFLLKYYEPRLLHIARGANTEGLTLPMLEELPVPNVALAEQMEFAAIVERYEIMLMRQQEALRQAQHLFCSLLDRAFRPLN